MMIKTFKHCRHLVYGLLLMASSYAFAQELNVTVQDQQGKPVQDAIVYIEGSNLKTAKPKMEQDIIQKGRQFHPLVTVVQTGTNIKFPNQDKVKHHVYSFSPAKKFELKLYSGVPATPVIFDQAGTVVLGCNIHDRMLAYVYIVDTPLFAKTNAQGLAVISDLPSGQYKVNTWHYALKNENAPVAQNVNLAEKANATVKLDINAAALVIEK
jgi:plastocyanin